MKNFLQILLIFCSINTFGQVSSTEQEYYGCKYLENPHYIINEKSVFFENCSIHRKVNVEASELVVLEKGLAYDGKSLFFNGIKLAATPKKPKVVCANRNDVFWINNTALYKNSDWLTEIDTATFKVFSQDYFGDKNNLFYLGEKVEGGDASTFVSQYKYSYDANYVYEKGEKVVENGYLKSVNGHFFHDNSTVYKYQSRSSFALMPANDIKVSDVKAIHGTKYGIVNNRLFYLEDSTAFTDVQADEIRVLYHDMIVYKNSLLLWQYTSNQLDASTLTSVAIDDYQKIIADKNGTYKVFVGAVGGEPFKIQIKKINYEDYEPDNYYSDYSTKLTLLETSLLKNGYPLVSTKFLAENGLSNTKNLELVSALKGYRPGCSQDHTPGSNYYILKNEKGYWELKISRENTLKFIGESYLF